MQGSQVIAVCVTGFSNLLHISQGRSALAKLFNVTYLEGLRELQCIFSLFYHSVVAAFSSGFKWVNEE